MGMAAFDILRIAVDRRDAPSLLTITKQKPHRYNTDGVLFYQLTNPDERS